MNFKIFKFPFKKVYCVSLKNSLDRRAHIKKELQKYNIDKYEFVDAVTENELIVAKAYENGLVKLYPPCFRCGKIECKCDNNVLLPTQVATTFSHKKIWEIISNQEEGMYLIIEDDVKFNTYYKYMKIYFHAKINAIIYKYMKEPLLLRLGWAYNEDHKFDFIKLIENSLKMSNPMYSINPKMAKVLLDEFKIIDTTVDVYTHKNIGLKYRNFSLFPPLAYDLSWSIGHMESLVRPRKKRIEYLESQEDEKSQQELKKYDEHIDRAIYKTMLVIGHPRTGSGYMSALLKAYGLDIGHEKMGKDGIVSWMFTVYDLDNPFYLNKYAKSRYYTGFKNIIMHVRDPFTAIPSIMRDNHGSEVSLNFRNKHILRETNVNLFNIGDNLERAIESYYYWTKIAIEKNNPSFIFKIEDDDKDFFEFLKEQNISVSRDIDKLPTNDINSNKAYKGKTIEKPIVSEDDWLNLDIRYKIKLNELCERFQYKSIFNKSLTKIIR